MTTIAAPNDVVTLLEEAARQLKPTNAQQGAVGHRTLVLMTLYSTYTLLRDRGEAGITLHTRNAALKLLKGVEDDPRNPRTAEELLTDALEAAYALAKPEENRG